MKITEDFIGNETKTLTKTKISTILRWWGFNPDSYSTWGNARVDMNNILSGSSSSTISDREAASSFLSKINYINDTDTVISDISFASNEAGVWFDPSDLSTLFQDAAGTMPVTDVEQPVGLMLDKSRSFGPNLAPSTGSLSGWNLVQTGGSVTVVDGGLFLNTTGTGTVAASFVGLTSSARYLFEFEVVSVSGSMYLEFGAGGVARVLTPGKHRWCITGRTSFYVRNAGPSATSGSLLIKNVVVRAAPGNHAVQATTTARPLLSARYNILTDTSFTSTAEWGMSSWVFSGGEADPFGGTAAAKIQMGSGTAQAPARIVGSVAGDVVFRVWWKAGNQTPVMLAARNDTTATILGTVRCDTAAVTGSGVTGRIIRQQNGFNLVELRTVGFPPGNTLRIYIGGTGGVPEGTHSFWYGPDLRLVCDADEGPTYQYVASAAASYEVAGFSPYLRFDGVDDFLDAGTLNFSAATQSTAVIGIKKLSDAIAARPYSHGLSTGQNGAFRFLAPANPGQASVRSSARGADGVLQETVGVNDRAAPIKLVLCSTYGANAPVYIRYNGTESRVSSGSLGALTLPSARSVIGAQVTGETTQSSFFLGRIYGLAHIARALSPVEQRILEQFIRNKSRAY